MMPEPLAVSSPVVNVVTASPQHSAPASAAMDHSPAYRASTPMIAVRTAAKQTSGRDSSWLELETCRDYLSPEGCPKGEELCSFAHPDRPILSEGGKVTCCYDFLKDRCRREHCKYFHPPTHIKERLVAAGKQFGAMMSGGLYSVSYPQATLPVSSFQPIPGCHNKQVVPGIPQYNILPTISYAREKLPICPEYMLGQCSQPLCSLAHPEPYIWTNADGTVTVCRDFVRSSGCPREQCRYYHPPMHPLDPSPVAGMYTNQSLFMPAMMSPSYISRNSLYYQPASTPYTPTVTPSNSTMLYYPAAMGPGSVFLPVSYPTSLFPVQPSFPGQSVSGSEVSPVTPSQTILSQQTIQH